MAYLSLMSDGSFLVSCVSSASLATALESLSKRGFATYELSTVSTGSLEGLGVAIASCFGVKWESSLDAMVDSVWQRLMDAPHERVCVIWRDATEAFQRHPQRSLDCVEIIQQLSTAVAQESTTNWSHPVILRVLIPGEGVDFPEWK